MMTLWRLSNRDTLGGISYPGGRWLAKGAPAVVLDPTPLSAICSRLALAEAAHPRQLPHSYRLLEFEVPPRSIHAPAAPHGWHYDAEAARVFGHDWLDRGEFLLLRVPSIAGREQFLLNRQHPDMALCRIQSCTGYPFDGQLDALQPFLAGQDWLARTNTERGA